MSNYQEASLTLQNLIRAKNTLFTVATLLNKNGIPYHLEGGTLLGLVRDKALLPWDHDVDISVPAHHTLQLLKLRYEFLKHGYKISPKKSPKTIGPIKKGEYYVIKVKPLLSYMINWFIPSYKKNYIVLDIFLKRRDDHYTYWEAKGKVMRVENKFYETYETVYYGDVPLKAPNHYREYLTQKYGDWSIPVKEWDCAKNELTIFTSD
ncbi:MAG TPA: LicD family protein [Ohtaekwangia sp.]|nr:LicD family protein [Ohtaekwangia sp.]